MRYVRRARGSNAIVGTFFILLLATLLSPSVAPAFIARYLPFIDEGIPCGSARQAEGRVQHQSLLGRAASASGFPLAVEVSLGPYPIDATGTLVVKLVLLNRSVGTVPFVFPGDVLINNATINGAGIVFNNQPIPNVQAQQTLVPDSNIRLLAPRQRCVLRVDIPAAQFGQYGISPGTFVKGFYRNATTGASQGILPGQTQLFPDQGLWVGVTESNPVSITSGA
jgi:hypothetical protein